MATERSNVLERGRHRDLFTTSLPELGDAAASLAGCDINVSMIKGTISSLAGIATSKKYAFYFALALYLSSPCQVPLRNSSHIPNVITSTGIESTLSLILDEFLDICEGERLGSDINMMSALDGGLDEVLWTSIIISRDAGCTRGRTLPVADLLYENPKSMIFFRHPTVVRYLINVWMRGEPRPRSIEQTSVRYLSSFSTPRVSHTLDLFSHLIYLGLFTHMLLQPGTGSATSLDVQYLVILTGMLASTVVHRPPSTRCAPVLGLFAYALSASTQPVPGTIAHSFLLLSFSWSVLLLLFPVPPTPVLLFPPSIALPPAVEIASLLVPIILRPLLYFLPMLFVTAILVSLSMDDPWSFVNLADFVRWPTRFPAAPYPTRITFFSLFCITVLFSLLFSVFSLIRHASRPPLSHMDVTSSSILAPNVAHNLLGAVLVYRRRYPFPPPLNLVCLCLVAAPRAITHMTVYPRISEGVGFLGALERALWFTLVLPFELVIAVLWGVLPDLKYQEQ